MKFINGCMNYSTLENSINQVENTYFYNNYFFQVPHGNTEKSVSVRARIISEIYPSKDFFEINKIPDIEQFYYIMKVILSNYYNTKIDDETVIKNIFKDTYAYEALAELKSTKYGLFFNEIDFKRIKDIYYTGVKKRLRLIKKYYRKGPPFPEPINIQEKLLENIVGCKFDDQNIVLVDGARRLVAGCLWKLREMKIILIARKGLKSSEER